MSEFGALLKKLEWISINDKLTPIELDDAITISVSKSVEIKNNILSITLKNPTVNYNGTDIYGYYVQNGTFTLPFSQYDQVTVWLKYTNDGADVESTTWNTNNELAGRFMISEYSMDTSENSTKIELRAVDTAYLLFNKVFSFGFGVGNTFTAPGIVRYLIRYHSESSTSTITNFPGTQNDIAINYQADAKFVSESGYITDYRTTETGGPSTTLNGALNSTDTTINVGSTTGFKASGTIVIDTEHIYYTGVTATSFTGCTRGIDMTNETGSMTHSSAVTVYQGFPAIILAKSYNALFDWFGDLTQIQNTNYYDELAADVEAYYQRAFLLWIDGFNHVHYLPADDEPDLTLDVTEEQMRGFKMEKTVFDSVNFVVYNAGEDMYGNGILYYFYDSSANVQGLKMRFQPMIDISQNFVKEDRKKNPARNTATTQDIFKQFPASYVPPIDDWAFKTDSNSWRQTQGQTARATLSNDTEYNDSLREAAKWNGLFKAQRITARRAGLRYRGQLAIKGSLLNPGDLIRTTNKLTGLNSQFLRVIQVTHQINNMQGWETTVEVEEDEKVYLPYGYA